MKCCCIRESIEKVKKAGKVGYSTAKQAICRSNQWLLSTPAKPTAFSKLTKAIVGGPPPRLEQIIVPKALYFTFWLIAMALASTTVLRMARGTSLRSKRDAVLVVITASAIVYHLTWAVYHWQDVLLKPIMPLLARYA
jgi:hypothetical protein